MIALAFMACLGVSPWHCQTVTLNFRGDGEGFAVTPFMCVLRGQARLAEWSVDHPRWIVTGGWRCGPVREARR